MAGGWTVSFLKIQKLECKRTHYFSIDLNHIKKILGEEKRTAQVDCPFGLNRKYFRV